MSVKSFITFGPGDDTIEHFMAVIIIRNGCGVTNSATTFNIMPLSITTISITKLSIMTFSIIVNKILLSTYWQHNGT
jgi:hypothetical protein